MILFTFGGAELQSKDLFWARVRARREAFEQAVSISKTRWRIAESITPAPRGSPPFIFRRAFEAAGWRPVSRAEAEEARLLCLRRAVLQKADTPYRTSEEFAVGVYQLELHDARRKSFSRCVTSMPVAENTWARHLTDSRTVTGDSDNGVAASLGPWRPGAPAISAEEWESRGHGIEAIPNSLLVSREARELLGRILEKSPGRKRGRPRKGGKAMSSTERSRRHRREKVT